MVEAERSDDGDVDLLELIRTLLQHWKTIVVLTILCTSIAVGYALYSPEVFRADTLLAPVQEEKSSRPASLNQFGGLAAIAGIPIPNDSNIEQVMATLQSRRFLQGFVDKWSLMQVFFEERWDAENQKWLDETEEKPTKQKAVAALRKSLSVAEDKNSGLITLSVSWKDSEIAAEWANLLVKHLNQQLREKAISDSRKRVGYLEEELANTTLQDMRAMLYNLLESEKQKAMLANVNEDFALEVIDPAVAPEFREKPKRKLIIMVGGLVGGIIGIFVVLFLQFFQKIKFSQSETQKENG